MKKKVSEITDADRLDFLSRQHFTRWVGYDSPDGNGYTIWGISAGDDLREQIDIAMERHEFWKDYYAKRQGSCNADAA